MTTRVRAFLLGVALPLVLLAGSFALTLSWRPRLPDPIALHWGVNGVDRVGSFSEQLTVMLVLALCLCVPAMILAIVVRGAARRGMVGLSAGLAVMVGGLLVGTSAVQLDVTDATTVPTPGLAIALSLLLGAVVGGVAVWLAGTDPSAPATAAVPDDAARLAVPDGGAAVWTRPLPSIPLAFPVVTLGLLLALTVAMGLLTGDWWMIVVVVLLAAAMLVTTGWRVRVDRTGLTLTGILGWPRYHVPATEVIRADAIQVSPIGDFGGWGMRVGRRGAVGFVTRKGEGLEVQRTGNRRTVVTVGDAARAAALLNTVAERSRQVGTSGPDR